MDISDLASTLDEGIGGWLQRQASTCGPARPDATATGTLLLASRVVNDVETVCENWHLTSLVMPHAHADWCVMQVSGPAYPVLALTEVVTELRAFGAR